jgi:hypothetical protein
MPPSLKFRKDYGLPFRNPAREGLPTIRKLSRMVLGSRSAKSNHFSAGRVCQGLTRLAA